MPSSRFTFSRATEWHAGGEAAVGGTERRASFLGSRAREGVCGRGHYRRATSRARWRSSNQAQQLAKVPTHAVPPFGATQPAGLRLMAHEVCPVLLARQQLTNPGRPQIDLLASLRRASFHNDDAAHDDHDAAIKEPKGQAQHERLLDRPPWRDVDPRRSLVASGRGPTCVRRWFDDRQPGGGAGVAHCVGSAPPRIGPRGARNRLPAEADSIYKRLRVRFPPGHLGSR
jgi:hypothetical protein